MPFIAETDDITYIGHTRKSGAHTTPTNSFVAPVEKAYCVEFWLYTKSSFGQISQLRNCIANEVETQIVMARANHDMANLIRQFTENQAGADG